MARQSAGEVADSVTFHTPDWTTVLQYSARSPISRAEGRTRKEGSQVVCFHSLGRGAELTGCMSSDAGWLTRQVWGCSHSFSSLWGRDLTERAKRREFYFASVSESQGHPGREGIVGEEVTGRKCPQQWEFLEPACSHSTAEKRV